MNHDSPTDIKRAMSAVHIRLKKRWGQNFMINRGARQKIVGLLDPARDECIWEIGAGLGALTEIVAPAAKTVIAFEIDHGLVAHLQKAFADTNVRIVAGDFMDNRAAAAEHWPPGRIVGNLPYSSAAAIIGSLVERGPHVDKMVFTLQKEVVTRVCSPPGSRDYSSFSVLCQAFFHVNGQGDLQPGSFYPAPEVQSGVVTMDLRDDVDRIRDRDILFSLIRSAFSARRKTLRNNLLSTAPFPLAKRDLLAVVESAGIESGVRAEAIAADDLVEVSNRIAELVTEG